MGWLRRGILLLLLLTFSCGGGGQEGAGFVLRLASEGRAFESILLRVSYPEGFYQERRTGPFLPGDRVEFKLSLPEGKERLIEVFLYGGGKPTYYRALFLQSLKREDRVLVELLPSGVELEQLERRSEGFKKGKTDLELFSQDLYSHNGLYEGYLVGSYAGYRVGKEVHLKLLEGGRVEFEKELRLRVRAE
ncbi:MAG: hypothetical protein N2648_02770, partial [Aquificaceae bacterium]|nr:hypothetical protein [Aquificaceae bacterium]